MQIKRLAQGHNILMPGFEPSTSVSKNRRSSQPTNMILLWLLWLLYFNILFMNAPITYDYCFHVLSQVSSYINSHNLYNTCQSAYRPGHSTETALQKVVNDLFLSLSKGNISVLALLDFSSAFDTIDHPILVHRLHTDFGFTDTVHQWFSSYLTDRHSSQTTSMLHGQRDKGVAGYKGGRI